jgi:hypothetical protein
VKTLALIVAVAIIALGVAGLVAPGVLVSIGRVAVTPVGLYVVAVLRVAIGLLLIRVAPASRTPRTLRVLGAMVVVAGLLTPFMGEPARAMLDWWSSVGTAYLRLAAALAIGFGGFIVYAVGGSPHPDAGTSKR